MDKEIFIIINSDYLVPEWQYKCILKLKTQKIVFLVAKELGDLKPFFQKRNYLKHFFYYCINLVSIRQRKIKIRFELFKHSSIKEIFFITKNNLWQELTKKTIEDIVSSDPIFIYKCGMNLLFINEELKKIPIISHHHGDPSKFRGRPAGFYELIKGEKKLGQIVQIISNKLDAGKILFYGETKVYPWSYKKTLNDAFKISPIIFAKALTNFSQGNYLNKQPTGKNYKLPSNSLCIIFIFKEIKSLINKILYGMFFEKFWQTGYLKSSKFNEINDPKDLFLYIDSLSNNFQSIKISKNYSFYADPFIVDSKIVVEGLNNFSCKGELLLIDLESSSIIKKYSVKNKHLSYPYTEEYLGKKYIYPDSAVFKEPFIYSGIDLTSLKKSSLKNFKNGLTDPSVIEYNGLFFLFANYPNEQFVLRLWVASNPSFSDVIEHKKSPILISPQGGRSGGRIFKYKDKIYRLGQDNTDDYGNGLILFEIKTLSKEYYYERKTMNYKLNGKYKGPHTFDISSNLMTWDFYIEKFNLFAGFKRIIGKF